MSPPILCRVGGCSSLRAPTLPYRRVHPKVGLQAIPQLVKWQGGESVGALVEEDVAVPEKVASLVA